MNFIKKITGIFIVLVMMIPLPIAAAFADGEVLSISAGNAFETGKLLIDFSSESSTLVDQQGNGNMTRVADTLDNSNFCYQYKIKSDATFTQEYSNIVTSIRSVNAEKYAAMEKSSEWFYAGFDFLVDEAALKSGENSDSFLGFATYDRLCTKEDGAATTVYQPNVTAVKIARNDNGTAEDETDDTFSFTSAKGSAINADKWYTLFALYDNVDRDNDGKYDAYCYISEKGAPISEAEFIAKVSTKMNHNVPTDIVPEILCASKLDAAKTAINFDNLVLDTLTVFNLDSIDSLYYSNQKVSFDFYVNPGFDEAFVSFGDEKVSIEPNANGFYKLSADFKDVTEGKNTLRIEAVYGDAIVYDQKEIPTYAFASSNAVKTVNSILYDSEKAAISVAGSSVNASYEQANDPDGSANKVTKISANANATSNEVQFYMQHPNGSYFTSTCDTIFGFDFYIDRAVATSDAETDFMIVGGKSDHTNWLISTSALRIGRKDGVTYLKTVSGDSIDLKKWYTMFIVFEVGTGSADDPVYYDIYIKERGQKDSQAKYVTTQRGQNTSTRKHPIDVGMFTVKGCDFSESNSPIYYIDNVYERDAIDFGADYSSRVYTPNDTYTNTVFIQPGFNFAKISIDGKERNIVDTEGQDHYYTIEKELSEYTEPCKVPISITADYYGKSITKTQYINIAKESWRKVKDSNGGDLVRDFTDAYIADNKASTTSVLEVNGRTPALGSNSGSAVYSIDTNGKAGNGDKTLKIDMTSTYLDKNNATQTEAVQLGYYNNLETIPNNSFVKVNYDIMFGSENFYMDVETQVNGSWSANSPYYAQFIANGKSYFVNGLKYEKNKWYTLSILYDSTTEIEYLYVDGSLVSKVQNKNFDNINVSRLRIFNTNATAENMESVWIDNYSVEITPYRYTGVKKAGYTVADDSFVEGYAVAADAKALTIEFNSNLGTGLVASAGYSDGTKIAETALSVNSDGNSVLTVSPSSFSELKDIVVTLSDESGVVLYEGKYIVKHQSGDVISEISLTQDTTKVYAKVLAKVDGVAGTLYLVGYNADYTKITNVAVTTVSNSATLNEFDASVVKTGDDVHYKAFLWAQDMSPIETPAEIDK